MATNLDDPSCQQNNVSNWGDLAEQLRQARLQQLENCHLMCKYMLMKVKTMPRSIDDIR